ncbi:MAG: AAA family ATPase [Planctomycetia bacterium]|nr:AAA family ATPase [Planctomycetia bacterium]
MLPTLQILSDGKERNTREINEELATRLALTADQRAMRHEKSRTTIFGNNLAWVLTYLFKANLLKKPRKGFFCISEEGIKILKTQPETINISFLKRNCPTFAEWLVKRRIPSKESETDESPSSVQYWIYAPGEQAKHWETYQKQGVMGIGWNEVGDLREYATREELRQKLVSCHPETNSNQSDAAHMLWNFLHTMKPGDIVYAKQGTKQIIGRGIVESDYFFDSSQENQNHFRKIKWETGSADILQKDRYFITLEEITRYTEVWQRFEKAFEKAPVTPEQKFMPYTEEDFLSDVFLDVDKYNKLVTLLTRKKNLIIQGPPGVGKTYCAKRLAYSMLGEKDYTRVMMIQFHQSYGYEDFVMGYRPTDNGFEIKNGPFYEFCKLAENDLERDYFFIIDEINRGNMSRIFGELLMLIENDKRGHELRLLYSNEQFSVPHNLYLIGLMNTADRSLAVIDYALRRRFAFVNFEPAFDSLAFKKYMNDLDNETFNSLIQQVKRLNTKISSDPSLGPGFQIGHSYFCNLNDEELFPEHLEETLSDLVEYDLIPLIQEYWFDESDTARESCDLLREALQ